MRGLGNWLARHRKAAAGLIAPGVASLSVALTTGDQMVSAHEWAMAGMACLVGAVTVYAVPNRQAGDNGA